MVGSEYLLGNNLQNAGGDKSIRNSKDTGKKTIHASGKGTGGTETKGRFSRRMGRYGSQVSKTTNAVRETLT